MDAQNCLAAFEIRIADRDLPIESSRTEKRRVEDVGPVGGGDDDDPRMRLEAVHFDQQLIEGLLALFVAERTAAAASPDGVELVDKDDARRVAAGILEEAPHAGRSHAGIHLDEVEPLANRNGTPASPAIDRARSVARAGADERMPLGMRPPIVTKRSGSRRKSTISLTSSLASSTPATSLNVMTRSPCSATRARPEMDGMRPAVVR